MNVVIRPYQAGDLEALLHITIESFDGVSFDQIVESKFGILNGHDWRWRKARQIGLEIGRQIHFAIPLSRPTS
ncbi:hypothetical protein CfE428DRAFT_6310 [Chthoniobacter flavus Ellin428]|uniref:Uncharacterized protein n=1 Tax=Chthoniobacter flavus Ellin428 TaxID=497964 RepID=B4DBL9_9BACT|nr:hypothetical protein [Chthoniobacter flavus]EDY16206.1 hypothetical protein CfE428DRAFT_6310 [Chthoniobacter flavus Ellin428]TCO87207.1 hypothetical protein EV701_12344 [Chthoniobacter flavus]